MPQRPNQNGDLGIPHMAITPVDRDVEAMLCKSQPSYFSREVENVGKQIEEWIKRMID